jgi:hypothetical protein
MNWRRFIITWTVLVCLLIWAEVWRVFVQWNWHALIDCVLLVGWVSVAWKVVQIARRLGV